MHILLPLIGALGAFGYWFFVLKRAGSAAGQLVDAAGRAHGAYKRRRFRNKAEASRIDAIDDPAIAATVMAVAVASCDGPMSAAQESVLREAMTSVMGIGDATEGLIFARWALDGVSDPDNVSLRLARLWNSRLTIDERRQLVDVVARVMAADHVPSAGQRAAILHLTKRLALTA